MSLDAVVKIMDFLGGDDDKIKPPAVEMAGQEGWEAGLRTEVPGHIKATGALLGLFITSTWIIPKLRKGA